MKKIVEFINSLFKILNITKNFPKDDSNKKEFLNNDVLDTLRIGDIIWAKRYNNELEKSAIPEGHQEGPYIVIGKNKHGLICSHGSSTLKDPNRRYIINNVSYSLRKDTSFKLFDFRIIDQTTYIRQLDQLSKKDLDMFFTKLKAYMNCYRYNNDNITLNIDKKIGDIILYNKKAYLVLEYKDNIISCLDLKKTITDFNGSINISWFTDLDYSNLKEIEDNENIIYITCLNQQMLLYVLRYQKQYLELKNNENIPKRGSIIIKDNELYYVNGEEGQFLLAFKLFENNILESDNLDICGKTFYTKYEDTKIDKKDNVTVCGLATEQEMNIIKHNRKSYKKIEKVYENKNNDTNTTLFKFGDIVQLKDMYDRYLVICERDSICCCILYESIRETFPRLHYFSINDIELASRMKQKARQKIKSRLERLINKE